MMLTDKMQRQVPKMQGGAGLQVAPLPPGGGASPAHAVDVEVVTKTLVEQARGIPAVRAVLAAVTTDHRLDVWTVLDAPDASAEHAVFECERAMERAHPDVRFDYGLLYRGPEEPVASEQWSASGWLILFERSQ
jgi:hypothetical protein